MSQLVALLLTLSIEAIVVLALVTLARWRPPGAGRWFIAALCVSLVTHPVAWWAHGVLPLPLWPRALTIEAAVIAVEAALYGRLLPAPALRALTASAAANGVSFGLGALLTA